jgi:hypothetical protein
MKSILRLFVFMLLATSLKAQSSLNVPVQNQFGAALSGVTVTLTCTDTVNGCFGKGPYTSVSVNGNALFNPTLNNAPVAGNYTLTINGPGITSLSYSYTVAAQPNGGIENPSSLNSIIFVDCVTYSCSPDIGASINTAYANLPANGGKIMLPPGSFNFSTPLNFGTANKPVIVEGSGSFATQLTYTGTLSSTAITMNYGPGVVTNHPRGNGLKNLTIIGPGASSTGIGLLLGGTNGAEGFEASGVNIGGFNIVVQIGPNNVWGTMFNHSIIRNGVTNLLNVITGGSNNGEQYGFVDTTFIQDQIGAFASCIALAQGNADTMFVNVSVDNCQIALSAGNFEFADLVSYWLVAQSAPLFSITGGQASGDALHLINQSASTTAGSVISMTAGVLNLNGIAINSSSYTFPVIFALSNGAQLSLFGSQSGGYTNAFSTSSFTGSIALHNLNFPADNFLFGAGGTDADIQIQNFGGGVSWAFDSQSSGNMTIFPKSGSGLINLNTSGAAIMGTGLGKVLLANQGTACTNGELALSAGWQVTGSASVTAVAGAGQTCSWTITTGTTTSANPTITDTLTNSGNASTQCWMTVNGGTHTPTVGAGTSDTFRQTTFSATAPVFTYNETPTAGGTTYFVTRGCGP